MREASGWVGVWLMQAEETVGVVSLRLERLGAS